MTRKELLGLVDTKTKKDGGFVFDTDDKKTFAKEVIEFFCDNFELDELTDNGSKDGFRFRYPENDRLFFAIKAGEIEFFLGQEVDDGHLKRSGSASGEHRILREQVLKLLSNKDGKEYLKKYIQESYLFCSKRIKK
ncbi:MAG: hypothetical protein PHQ03_07360 [Methylococcales bacterium]|nr:hypothetical protein [Methylococcales bacterium]